MADWTQDRIDQEMAGDNQHNHEDGADCGGFNNGKFSYYDCRLAGTEYCDWECPYSRKVTAVRIAKMKARAALKEHGVE
jgi:hypothetical protein